MSDRSPRESGAGRQPTVVWPAGPLPARWAAFRILSDRRLSTLAAREALDLLVGRGDLSATETPLATELVMGVLRHRLTLVHVLGQMTSTGWTHVDRPLRQLLLIGGYQLIWLDGVPSFAAVSEAVNQAKAVGGGGAGRFVNAVLRRLLREIADRRVASEPADSVRAVPVNATQSCLFHRAVLPDPKEEPVQFLAASTSVPTWLVKRWVKHFGFDPARQICQVAVLRAPMFCRPNSLRTTPSKLVKQLKSEDIEAEALSTEEAIVVSSPGAVMRTSAFETGLFQPQDVTAMGVVKHMNLQPGQGVLDLCAGLGTKTTQIVERMKNEGTVIACDKEESKLAALRANCDRLGHTIVRTMTLSELLSQIDSLPVIHWILIDVPCSNSGVLARRPEARYRMEERSLKALAATQGELMALADRLAGDSTRLMYSTCSIEPEENEQVSACFAESHPQWRLADSRLTLPQVGATPADWRDGGYWASWVRK